MKRLLAAATVLAASAALAPPASAQPCVSVPEVNVCYLDFGSAGRGASVIVFPAGYGYVLAGCYYPGGSARYYVAAGSSETASYEVTAPVGGVPCV